MTVATDAIEVVRGLPFEAYLARGGCSQSALNTIRTRSPAHCRCPSVETDAMAMGTLAHACVIEPDRFAAEYAVVPDMRRGTKAWEQAEADNPGKVLVKESDYADLLAVRRAVWSHGTAKALLERSALREVSLFWHRDGVPCRARFDAVTDAGVVVDFKTAASARRCDFARSIGRYGYHIQAAWYTHAAKLAGYGDDPFMAFIVAETTPPYAVAVYTLDDATMEYGRREADRLFAVYAECHRTDTWPAYGSDAMDIGLAEWQMKGDEQ